MFRVLFALKGTRSNFHARPVKLCHRLVPLLVEVVFHEQRERVRFASSNVCRLCFSTISSLVHFVFEGSSCPANLAVKSSLSPCCVKQAHHPQAMASTKLSNDI